MFILVFVALGEVKLDLYLKFGLHAVTFKIITRIILFNCGITVTVLKGLRTCFIAVTVSLFF